MTEPPTPEESLIMAIVGMDPENDVNVTWFREHHATCKLDDHSYCWPTHPEEMS